MSSTSTALVGVVMPRKTNGGAGGRPPNSNTAIKKEVAILARKHGSDAVDTLAKIMHGLPDEARALGKIRELVFDNVGKTLDPDLAKLFFFWLDELVGTEVSAQTRAWCADKMLDRGYGKPTEHINLESDKVPSLVINFVSSRKPAVGTGDTGAGAGRTGDGELVTGTE